MIYDSIQKALYADDGRFIKRIYCPLTDVPAHLRKFVGVTADQFRGEISPAAYAKHLT